MAEITGCRLAFAPLWPLGSLCFFVTFPGCFWHDFSRKDIMTNGLGRPLKLQRLADSQLQPNKQTRCADTMPETQLQEQLSDAN